MFLLHNQQMTHIQCALLKDCLPAICTLMDTHLLKYLITGAEFHCGQSYTVSRCATPMEPIHPLDLNSRLVFQCIQAALQIQYPAQCPLSVIKVLEHDALPSAVLGMSASGPPC